MYVCMYANNFVRNYDGKRAVIEFTRATKTKTQNNNNVFFLETERKINIRKNKCSAETKQITAAAVNEKKKKRNTVSKRNK